MDSKTRAKFDADLPRVHAKLLAEALFLVQRTGWRGERDRNTAAQELVQEAVVRSLGGQRTWDPAKVPDLDFWRSPNRC